MLWPVRVQACHTLKTLGNTERKLPYHEYKQQWSERYSRCAAAAAETWDLKGQILESGRT